MTGSVAPYTAADTAAVRQWAPFVALAYSGPKTVAECDADARRSIARLERLGLLTGGAVRLMLETFDLVPLDHS